MQHSWVVVDSREGALKESGDVILSKVCGGVYFGSCDHHDTQAEVYAELGEVAAGTKKLPSFNKAKNFIVFKSLGKNTKQLVLALTNCIQGLTNSCQQWVP